jgi:hypothetical protein
MYDGQTTEEAIRDRLLPVFSAMILYMNHNNMETMEYKTVFPLRFSGEMQRIMGMMSEDYEVTVVVRKRE